MYDRSVSYDGLSIKCYIGCSARAKLLRCVGMVIE
jgi:hypothetical protein